LIVLVLHTAHACQAARLLPSELAETEVSTDQQAVGLSSQLDCKQLLLNANNHSVHSHCDQQTDGQTDGQTDSQTDRQWQKHWQQS